MAAGEGREIRHERIDRNRSTDILVQTHFEPSQSNALTDR